ncbi:MAG: 16S rRNA (cytosine(1402)-N(4))-methyltransferase RsmH [Planctomycetes bacterium]|nr:16S rRNA (cytosine(1402)-N(4))-methyltransferase RsmH [Planctomycetota bacterium]
MILPTEQPAHVPVMLDTVLHLLRPSPGEIFLDCTIGSAGHASAILEKIGPLGLLIGLDCDGEVLPLAAERLRAIGRNFKLYHANFADVQTVAEQAGVTRFDGILADTGLSSFALDAPERGFSLMRPGPLDGRMDRSKPGTIKDMISKLDEHELADIIFRYGEERYSRRIARAIVRQRHQIMTTTQLAELVRRTVPAGRHRIHPATRTFQSLRLAITREVEALEKLLVQAPLHLKPGGRVAVITFESLTDRLVKNAFRSGQRAGLYAEITRKPLTPSADEIERNPRSRSGKLRVAVRSAA